MPGQLHCSLLVGFDAGLNCLGRTRLVENRDVWTLFLRDPGDLGCCRGARQDASHYLCRVNAKKLGVHHPLEISFCPWAQPLHVTKHVLLRGNSLSTPELQHLDTIVPQEFSEGAFENHRRDLQLLILCNCVGVVHRHQLPPFISVGPTLREMNYPNE